MQERQQLLNELAVVFAVPFQAQRTMWIGPVIEDVRCDNSMGVVAQSLPVFAEAIDGDCFQPKSKGTDATVVVELRQSPHHDGQHILHDVVAVTDDQSLALQPAPDERFVKCVPALPGQPVRPGPNQLQQTVRRAVHDNPFTTGDLAGLEIIYPECVRGFATVRDLIG